jgi:hypothetical protein
MLFVNGMTCPDLVARLLTMDRAALLTEAARGARVRYG